jgi:DnaJ-class molecular chaperone
MAHHVAVIRLELGTPEHSIWCNACMTSGGFRIPLQRLSPFGVTHMATAQGCTTCEGRGDLEA